MTFFRLVLCLTGLFLYLLVKEFSSDSATVPVQNVLQPVPVAPLAAEPVTPAVMLRDQR